MQQVMSDSPEVLQSRLIEIAAKHVADMRLIKNVHNEYKIFEQKVFSPGGIPNLRRVSLFAMILYKNAYLSDFEKVRAGGSKIDTVYSASRRLVAANVSKLNKDSSESRESLAKLDAVTDRADRLGAVLVNYVARVARHAGDNASVASYSTSGADFSGAALRTPEFWERFSSTGADLVAVTHNGGSFTFSRDDLQDALGDPLDVGDRRSADEGALQASIDATETTKSFLVHAEMSDLIARPEFTVEMKGEQVSLASIATSTVGTGLALDLLTEGFIDQNYMLYVSQYYGDHVTVEAMNFILHNVQPNVADFYFEFGGTVNIENVFKEAGASVLNDESMFNVEIFDYLLEARDERLTPALRNIGRWTDTGREFAAEYVTSGSLPDEFLSRAIPSWKHGFQFVIATAGLDGDFRLRLLDAAIRNADPATPYLTDEVLRDYIAKYGAHIPVLGEALSSAHADRVAVVLRRLGVEMPKLESLGDELRLQAIENSIYVLDAANLSNITGHDDIGLDEIRGHSDAAFTRVLAHLDEYINLADSVSSPTISDGEQFVELLELVLSADPDLVEAISNRASAECKVESIEDAPQSLWSALAATSRFTPSFDNIKEYLEYIGDVDESIATLLSRSRAIEVDEDEVAETLKESMALTLLNSELLRPEDKIALVGSLRLVDVIDAAGVRPVAGTLFGLLVEAGEIDDAASSYRVIAAMDWSTKEAYLSRSSELASYLADIPLQPGEVRLLLESQALSSRIKTQLVREIDELAVSLENDSLTAIAEYAIAQDLTVGIDSLDQFWDHHVRHELLVQLLRPHLGSISADRIVSLLQSMGEPYAGLTRRGWHSVWLPTSEYDYALVDRMYELGYVSSKSEEGTQLKVNMKHK